jgi:C-terminal processing protease CtpA/Prc
LTPPVKVQGPLGSVVAVRVRGADGGERSVDVRCEGAWWPPERPSIRWRTVERLPGQRIGYLRTVRFDDDVAPLVDTAMRDLKDTTGLIVDVRDNGGGNMSFVRLCSHLTPGQNFVAALVTRPFLERHQRHPENVDPRTLPKAVAAYTTARILEAMRANGGVAAFYTEDLGDRVYRGKVVVLLNEGTSSAAEAFTWHMKLNSKATLIGRTTAGYILGGETFLLPSGWRLTVPTHVGLGPDGKPFKDTPTTPHLSVTWSLRDLREGCDPVLAKALEVLTGDK